MKREWKVEATYVEDGEPCPSDLLLEHDPDDVELPFTLYQPGSALYASRDELVAFVGTAVTALVETASSRQDAEQMMKKLDQLVRQRLMHYWWSTMPPTPLGGQTTPEQP
jgi:hypothetical protein